MPTYEFRCPECGRVEDHESSMDRRNDKRQCGLCGAVMARLLAAPCAIFKGDGFYSSRRKRALKKELDRRTEEKQK